MEDKKQLYSEDYELLNEEEKASIEDTIAVLKHEGYEDDGFLRDILAKRSLGKITFEEADQLIDKRHGV